MVPEETLDRAAVDDVSPRYLRKQKPSEVRRRRPQRAPARSRRRRAAIAAAAVVAAGAVLGGTLHFLLYSPAMRLHPAGVEVRGIHYVSRSQVLDVFAADMGRSAVRVPLEARLAALKKISWVRRAAVERVLPDALVVQITEREPVAYFHARGQMKLIDDDGVLLDRPAGVNFNLPVVTGIDLSLPVKERGRRMERFAEFLKAIRTVRPDAPAEVSEANLGNPGDVQVTLAGAPELAGQGPVVVHFGADQFADRYRLFLEDFASWKVRAGNVEEVDLRYDGQALVTPANPLAVNATPAPGGVAPAAAPVEEPIAEPGGKPAAPGKTQRPAAGKQGKGRVSQ
jgi:cell division protein FtsQ